MENTFASGAAMASFPVVRFPYICQPDPAVGDRGWLPTCHDSNKKAASSLPFCSVWVSNHPRVHHQESRWMATTHSSRFSFPSWFFTPIIENSKVCSDCTTSGKEEKSKEGLIQLKQLQVEKQGFAFWHRIKSICYVRLSHMVPKPNNKAANLKENVLFQHFCWCFSQNIVNIWLKKVQTRMWHMTASRMLWLLSMRAR